MMMKPNKPTPGIQPKPLHLGTHIDDLEKLYMKLPADIRDRELDLICRSAKKLIEQSDRYYLEKDEEQAYVGYMRLMNLVQTIRQNKEYTRKKQMVTKLLGTQADFNRIFTKLDLLKTSLEARYREQALRKASATPSIRVVPNNERNQATQSATTYFIGDKQAITAKELHDMMNDPRVSLLIMDCRSAKDFEESHLRYTYLVNVPEHLLVAGMTAGKINHALPSESRILWSNRMVKEHVVLMDWNTSGIPVKDTPIYVLNYILCHYDQDIEDTKIIRLDGGYESFLLYYPACCTNPSYRPPIALYAEGENIDDIEYPNISDIPMKEDSFSKPGFKPTIDRNSKVAAVSLYQARQKPLEDILVEHEQILDKSKQNALDIINTEKELQNLEQQEPSDAGLDETQESLLFEVMQLKDRQRDYEAEKARILEEEESYKEMEKEKQERGERISTEQAERLEREAYERRLLEKEREQRELEEKCQRLAREREAKLALAREQKRHLKENVPEGPKSYPDQQPAHVANTNRMPLFDRSAKPLADHNHNVRSTRDLDVVQRDFAPVYGNVGRGLTGLKNLGNTCYMNSILQCLSNTYFLNEFFHDASFKMRLNRNNKTQGKIGEEVAAVIKALWTGQYKCIASKNLRYVVGQYERQFGGIEQQDSHEFLTILMDWLHSDLQTIQMQISTSLDQLPPSEKAWIEHFKGKGSYISELFYGQIKSTVKCTRCHKESATYESFSNLSLELPQDSNICYLENCLDMYFNGEEVRGWHCPKCKSNQDAIKKLDISRLPSIMVIHFKRFYADPETAATVYRKKQTLVKFPLSDLNMTRYLARTEVNRNKRLTTFRYHLYGVSNHYGSMESGHYTAFCLNNIHQKWFKFDDYNVSSIDAADVQASAAYILFYSCLPDRPQSDVR
ncbi:ubiquitin carboxyl-terminal hydrolase 8-like isoform X1 [Anopheles albimanus]|uniref:ubiquitin carboxyl-terminal hydrolase 8-like isoform X1 n=1 Tax=Anopheles albimanus TaxID=7167 RepID=UPI001640D618|nr:ubiquitin carboxyl-terminal hydrolase 8-like isoform X1 [Anopheles albimanus]